MGEKLSMFVPMLSLTVSLPSWLSTSKTNVLVPLPVKRHVHASGIESAITAIGIEAAADARAAVETVVSAAPMNDTAVVQSGGNHVRQRRPDNLLNAASRGESQADGPDQLARGDSHVQMDAGLLCGREVQDVRAKIVVDGNAARSVIGSASNS